MSGTIPAQGAKHFPDLQHVRAPMDKCKGSSSAGEAGSRTVEETKGFYNAVSKVTVLRAWLRADMSTIPMCSVGPAVGHILEREAQWSLKNACQNFHEIHFLVA